MKQILCILLVTLAGCGISSDRKKSVEKVASTQSLSSSKSEVGSSQNQEVDTIYEQTLVNFEFQDLPSTVWISEVAPGCVDSLIFNFEGEGYEYRCEFLIKNRLTYSINEDTLTLNEYGLISEVDASLGEEIKSEWQYIIEDDQLKLINKNMASSEYKYTLIK